MLHYFGGGKGSSLGLGCLGAQSGLGSCHLHRYLAVGSLEQGIAHLECEALQGISIEFGNNIAALQFVVDLRVLSLYLSREMFMSEVPSIASPCFLRTTSAMVHPSSLGDSERPSSLPGFFMMSTLNFSSSGGSAR